MFTTELLQLD